MSYLGSEQAISTAPASTYLGQNLDKVAVREIACETITTKAGAAQITMAGDVEITGALKCDGITIDTAALIDIPGSVHVGESLTADEICTTHIYPAGASLFTMVHSELRVDNDIRVDANAMITGNITCADGDITVNGTLFCDTISPIAPATTTNMTGLMTVAGNINAASRVIIADATASTSINTGALTVVGGTGIGGDIHVGGNAIITGTLTCAGLSFPAGDITVNGTLFCNTISPIAPETTTSLTGNITTGGVVSITNATVSTSTATGAITIAGGVGIGGALYVGGASTITSGTDATNTSTGALIISGGASIMKKLYVGTFVDTPRLNSAISFIAMGAGGNTITMDNTTGQVVYLTGSGVNNLLLPNTALIYSGWSFTITNGSSGDVVLKTFAGITQGYLAPGSTITMTFGGSSWYDMTNGLSSISQSINNYAVGATSTTTGAIITRGGFAAALDSYFGANVLCPTAPTLANHLCNKSYCDGLITNIINNGLSISATTASTNATTGALIVAGGVGIVGAANIGGILRVYDTTASTNTTTGALIVAGGAGIAGAANIGGILRTYNATTSTNTTTGALIVAGGAGIAGAANIGGILRVYDTTASTAYTNGALIVAGGAGIAGDVRTNGTVYAGALSAATTTSSARFIAGSRTFTPAVAETYELIATDPQTIYLAGTKQSTIVLENIATISAGWVHTIVNKSSVRANIKRIDGATIDWTVDSGTSLHLLFDGTSYVSTDQVLQKSGTLSFALTGPITSSAIVRYSIIGPHVSLWIPDISFTPTMSAPLTATAPASFGYVFQQLNLYSPVSYSGNTVSTRTRLMTDGLTFYFSPTMNATGFTMGTTYTILGHMLDFIVGF